MATTHTRSQRILIGLAIIVAMTALIGLFLARTARTAQALHPDGAASVPAR